MTMMKPCPPRFPGRDLQSRREIQELVDAFYQKVRTDELLATIFDDVAGVDWESHLPRMYDFWEAVLFGRAVFKGNPLQKHIDLSMRTSLGPREFDRWLELFRETIEGLFEGPVAADALARAERIAQVMQHHIAAASG